jgi:hypothetical protein
MLFKIQDGKNEPLKSIRLDAVPLYSNPKRVVQEFVVNNLSHTELFVEMKSTDAGITFQVSINYRAIVCNNLIGT